MKMTVSKRKLRVLTLVLSVLLTAGVFVMPVSADNHDYGTSAWLYLEYIDQNLPQRITNIENYSDTERKTAAGDWIAKELSSFGYTVNRYQSQANGNTCTALTVVKPGNSERKVVIGAHYDCVDTKGVEDNGTGVSLLLELAGRFANTETPMTLEFCFWDGEEFESSKSAWDYLERASEDGSLADIYLYINLDTIGSGDDLYVYGGVYDGDILDLSWGYFYALEVGSRLGIKLKTLPASVNSIGKAGYCSPTRTANSDQQPFAVYGVPYIYFEATDWSNLDVQSPQCYTTADARIVADDGGKLIHNTDYEDLATLEALFPGRIKTHLTQLSYIVSTMLRELQPGYSDLYTPSYTITKTSFAESLASVTAEDDTVEEETVIAEESTSESSDAEVTTSEESLTEETTSEKEDPYAASGDETEKESTETASEFTETEEETDGNESPGAGEKLNPSQEVAGLENEVTSSKQALKRHIPLVIRILVIVAAVGAAVAAVIYKILKKYR